MKHEGNLKVFGHTVKRMRLAAGLSQQDLADRCSAYKDLIPNIEEGTADVRLTMVLVLADALKVNPADLLKDASAV